jgi:hypothetical protein
VGKCASSGTTRTRARWGWRGARWGGRLTEDLETSWEALGRALRSEGMRGQEAWVLSPPSDLSGLLRMKAERKLSFSAARDKLRFTQYKIRA